MNVTTNAYGRPLRRRLLGALMAPAIVLGLAACDTNQGISAEDAAAIRDQIQQVADRLDAVEQRLMDLSAEGEQNEPAQLISEVREVSSDVGEARSLDEVSQQLEPPAEETAPPAGDPLAPPAGDPLAPPPGSDPLAPPADDPLAPPPGGAPAPDGGLDAPAPDGGLDTPAPDGGLDSPASDDGGDLPQGEDGGEPAPLDDPLVPNAPDL